MITNTKHDDPIRHDVCRAVDRRPPFDPETTNNNTTPSDVRPGEVLEIEPENSGGLLTHLPWWLVAVVAFAVAELTAHPSIGVILFCLKFGWNDFLTALWLRYRDPVPHRGATCGWFYLSSGLWRVCISSVVLLFSPLDREFCWIVWLLTSGAAGLITLIAVEMVSNRQIKVWVSGSMAMSRHRQEWPPQPGAGRHNQLLWWLLTTYMLGFLTLFAIGMIGVLGRIGAPNVPPGAGVVIGVRIFGAIALIVSALASLVIANRVFVRVGSITPAECWPELIELDNIAADRRPSS